MYDGASSIGKQSAGYMSHGIPDAPGIIPSAIARSRSGRTSRTALGPYLAAFPGSEQRVDVHVMLSCPVRQLTARLCP